jgi:hypothetical protein
MPRSLSAVGVLGLGVPRMALERTVELHSPLRSLLCCTAPARQVYLQFNGYQIERSDEAHGSSTADSASQRL